MSVVANATASLGSEADGEPFRVARLDLLCDLPVTHVIKIDVEGAEAQVLRDARTTPARSHPALVVEIHGMQEPAVRDALGEIGYAEPGMMRDGGMPHLLAAFPRA